jgi:hypothetical protein
MSDNSFQFFWKNSSRPLSSSSLLSSSLLVCFDWFKTWWVHQPGLYKTSLYTKAKDATIQDLDLKIIIYFNSPIIKHWTPLNQTPHILFILLSNWKTFATLEVLGWGVKNFLELQNEMHNVWGFDLIGVLECSLTDLSTLAPFPIHMFHWLLIQIM